MSPLAKEIIKKLNEEQDNQVLSEVLDFYEYLKQKRLKESQEAWGKIKEDDPTEEETKICDAYKNKEKDLVGIEEVMQELEING